MIFQHNFVHGDLHPGNIFIEERTDQPPRVVFLDVGIAQEYTASDHELLVNVLSAFIRCDGRKAAALLVSDSDARLVVAAPNVHLTVQTGTASGITSRSGRPEDIKKFQEVIQAMVEKAKDDPAFFDQLGNYFSIICNAACTHHVKMNQGFLSIALAVKVVEGVALELNPVAEIWRIANPLVIKSEFRRRLSLFLGRDMSNHTSRELMLKEDKENLSKLVSHRRSLNDAVHNIEAKALGWADRRLDNVLNAIYYFQYPDDQLPK